MLYSVTAHNTQGIDGTVQLSNGKQVTTSHPLNNQSGFNPEVMIALAWSTCFKATLDTILKEKGLNHLSYVDVTVDLHKEPEMPGYYFAVKGQAAIDNMSLDAANALVQEAHARCPVSKLIGAAHAVSLKTVPYKLS